jgi:hypothetical protein
MAGKERSMGVRMSIVAALIALVVLLSVVVVAQELLILSPPPSTSRPPEAFEASSLELSVTPQSPVSISGGNVTLVVDVYNPLVFSVQVTENLTGGWCLPGNGCCSGFLSDFQVFAGYYTADNVSEGTPLTVIFPAITSCPSMGPVPVQFTFYQHSDVAIVSPVNYYGSSEQVVAMNKVYTLSGYWTFPSSQPNITLQAFPPGTYTVLASDIWGHRAMCYFEISNGQPSGVLYNVTFQQDGVCTPEVWLAPWSVTVADQTKAQPASAQLPLNENGWASTQNRSLSSIYFLLPDGSYSYQIHPSRGFNSSSGVVNVAGGDVVIHISPIFVCIITATSTP